MQTNITMVSCTLTTKACHNLHETLEENNLCGRRQLDFRLQRQVLFLKTEDFEDNFGYFHLKAYTMCGALID